MMHNIKTSSQELKSYHKVALKQIPLKRVPREPRRKGALPPPPSPATRLHGCMCACVWCVVARTSEKSAAVLSSGLGANRIESDANNSTKSGAERSSLIHGCRGWSLRVSARRVYSGCGLSWSPRGRLLWASWT